MGIQDKILKAYFHVAEKMGEDKDLTKTVHFFHRNKKYAFFVGAERLDEDGWLPGEKQAAKPTLGEQMCDRAYKAVMHPFAW